MSNNKKTWNKMVLDIYCDRPIAFIPSLGRIGGGATAGLFISQLLYWGGKGYDAEWIYKTIDEMEKETCLSRSEQDNAIRSWMKLGVIQKEVRGIPPKRYFRIDLERLFQLLDIANHIAEPIETTCDNEQNIYTENTLKTTFQRPVKKTTTRLVKSIDDDDPSFTSNKLKTINAI